MKFFSNDEPLDEDELSGRRQAIKNTILCIGCIRIVFVLMYGGMFVLIHYYSKELMTTILKVMLLIIITPEMFLAGLLLFGTLKEKSRVLTISIWLCVVLAAYNTILGVTGATYYVVKAGRNTVYYVIAAFFCIEALWLFVVLFYDISVIHSLRRTIEFAPPFSQLSSSLLDT